MMAPGYAPSDVRPAYRKLEAALLVLLRHLSPDDWQRPATPKWTVKDVVAHLVDGHLRQLSMGRDGYFGENPGPIERYQDLVAFLNGLNADWVKACVRLSPAVLIEWIESSSRQVLDYYGTLDLGAPALFAVAWAGEEQSTTAFHLARELTERWHHQQQIRVATGRKDGPQPITTPELYRPVLATFMRAFAHHYRGVSAAEGTSVRAVIEGNAGGEWTIVRTAAGWQFAPAAGDPAARVRVPEAQAWRLFTRGLSAEAAERCAKLEGDTRLARHFLTMTSVMA